ncbi:MAG: exodeoxyribonuclease VII large subunit [Acidobacteriota bacterium]
MVKFFNEKPLYSVSEITKILDTELSTAFADIFVEGEVGDCVKSKSGHIYFKLKDEEASIKVVIFRSAALKIGFSIENGMLLIVRGRISLYQKTGDLQLYADYAEPSGIGALQMKIEQAKKNLQKDGLTDPQRKRKIPPYPRCVGVVTSLEGAAIRDFISILKRRGAAIDVIIACAAVQGKDSVQELKNGLKKLYERRDVDIIVITRGGGSMEDLMSFNDESLARLLAESPIPTISAVGHEIDTVLTDLTADLRAPTPSAAAEIISQSYFSLRNDLINSEKKIAEAMRNILYLKNTKLTIFDEKRGARTLIWKIEKLEERRDRSFNFNVGLKKILNLEQIAVSISKRLSPSAIYSNHLNTQKRVKTIYETILSKINSKLELLEINFNGKVQMIQERSPMNILSRGYAIVKNREGKAIKRSLDVELNEILKVILFEGELKVKVEEKSS